MSKLNADVMLLAAGLGTRLRPLTDKLPKPLVRVGGKALIDWNLEMVARSKLQRVIINLHYLGDQIRAHVGDGSKWGLRVEYSEEPVLLDTGGGIKNIESWIQSEQLLVVNADIILGPDFSLVELLERHCSDQRKPLATLALRHDSESARYGEIGIDPTGRICSFLGKARPAYGSGTAPFDRLMFLGVHILSRDLFSSMPKRGTIFSITRETYQQALAADGVLASYIYDGYWSDLGTPDRLEAASKKVMEVFR